MTLYLIINNKLIASLTSDRQVCETIQAGASNITLNFQDTDLIDVETGQIDENFLNSLAQQIINQTLVILDENRKEAEMEAILAKHNDKAKDIN